MKKILIRTGMSPLVNIPVPEILTHNRLGNNVGNLVYAYSVYRGLMTNSDVELIPTEYLVGKLDVDKINEEFDSFVIPLADFIRPDRVGEIKAMTKLINKLKIPCPIVGIGIRAEYDVEKNGILFEEDKVAYDFFKAVLNKSSIIGVRGEITGDYLKKLGFVPEVDYTVIGCPSFFTFGEDLQLKEASFSKTSKVAINNTSMVDENVQNFLTRIIEEFSDCLYYPQRLEELRTLYLGKNYIYPGERYVEGFPDDLTCPVYQKDITRFHTNFYSWLNDLRDRDLSFGPRLHGNAVAVLAGVPSLWVIHDARTRELADYHNLPTVKATEIHEQTDLLELFFRVDYKSVLRGHKERFHHYIDFLEKNGIEHIFKDYKNPKMAPLEQKMRELGIDRKDYSVTSVLNCSVVEVVERLNQVGKMEREVQLLKDERNNEIKEKLKKTRVELKSAKEENKKLTKELKKASQLAKEKDDLLKAEKKVSKKEKEKREELEGKLQKKKEELEEAKRSFTFLVRRKIQKILKKK